MAAANPGPEIPAQYVLSPFAPTPRTLIDNLYDTAPLSGRGTGELVIGGAGLARYLDSAKDTENYAPMPTAQLVSLDWLFPKDLPDL